VRTVQQLSTNPARTAGRMTSACAAATVVAHQAAFACGLESRVAKPWIHGDRDPRRHPGQEDV